MGRTATQTSRRRKAVSAAIADEAAPGREGVAGRESDAGSTEERIVDAAMKLFLRAGYGPTSVADILAEAGANSGSLYHFFASKEQLLVRVLERYQEILHPVLLMPAWQGVDDPIERVFALLARYRLLLLQSRCTYGCPIGSLALEIHDPSPPVRVLLASNFSAWVDAVEGCFVETGDRLPRDVDRRALAQFVLSTMEGGVMQARTHRSIIPFDACIAMLRDHLRRLEDAARATRTSRPVARGGRRSQRSGR